MTEKNLNDIKTVQIKQNYMTYYLLTTDRISLSCKLVPVHYRKYEHGLFELSKFSAPTIAFLAF